MYFHNIGRNRYRVYKNKGDVKFCGIVEKQEYVSINMITGKRVLKHLWKASGIFMGWRQTAEKSFSTREAAAEFILKDAATPYNKKKTRWIEKQGESAAQKMTKIHG